MKRVSVVVPVLNGAGTIGALLASLEAQTLPHDDFEVCVVDDGSTDGTQELVRAFALVARSSVRLIERPHAGPAAARNAGLGNTSGEIVAFTDADVEVTPQWLAHVLLRFETALDIAGVEGRTLPKGTPGTLTHQMRNVSGGLYMTCNIAYRRDWIDRAGGFDERFGTAFLEDSDLAFRVMTAGGEIVFDPEVLVYHQVLHEGRRKFWKEARKRFYVPLIMRSHPGLYKQLLRPVVPAYPGIYIEELLAVLATVFSVASSAWAAAIPSVLLMAISFRRVAHAWRARDTVSILQAISMPFVQGFWVTAGWLRFMRAERVGGP